MKSKEIGGFLELELNNTGSLLHDKAIRVNTGRNALEYIIRANNYSKLYLPYYTCDAVIKTIKNLNIAFSFYSIDERFLPKFDFSSIKENEAFIYTNYFGLFSNNIDRLLLESNNLILDNAQAFYYICKKAVPAFYSPRKFFGVPDGGFLYNQKRLNKKLKLDSSVNRLNHLVGRLEKNAESFYADYINNETELQNVSLRQMSKLTEKLLHAINYEEVKTKRRENYRTLSTQLHNKNELDLPELAEEDVPLCYPLLLSNGQEIKKKLIQNKIYIPTYWPNVSDCTKSTSFEYYLVKNLICLPIDQRYSDYHMRKIIAYI